MVVGKLLYEYRPKFSGRSSVAVLQEYYAMMFVLNCIAAMSATVNRKHEQQNQANAQYSGQAQ